MKKITLFFLLLFPVCVMAQSNYKEGFVVTNKMDTLKGFINYLEKSNNPSKISFKPSLEAKPLTYDLHTASAFTINGYESYERFVVNISQASTQTNRLSAGLDTSYVRDTVFLKIIQKGQNVSFYSFADNIKKRFYLLEKDKQEPEELIYRVYLVNESGKVSVVDRYKRQLVASMLKHNAYGSVDERRLSTLAYSAPELLREVSKINGQKVEKEKAAYRFFAGAGLSINQTKYSGESQFSKPGTVNKTSYTPMLTAGIDLLGNPHIGKVVYRLEFSYMMMKGDITTTAVEKIYAYRRHTFESMTLGVIPQIIYNFYNTSALKVYGGAGAGLHFSKHKNNQTATKVIATDLLRIEEDKVLLQTYYFAPTINAGIVLGKKYEIFGNYYINAPLTDYVKFNVNLQRTNIGIRFIIPKK
jgi:hypothetical protein